MKKITLNIAAMAFAVSGFAQLQLNNPGFEDWSTNTAHPPNSYDEPDGWGIDACANVNDGPWTCDIFAEKSTDANSGTYAIKIQNTAGNYGRISIAADGGGIGANFTGSPTSISFYVKTALAAGESFKVNVSTFDASFNIFKTAEKTYSTSYSSYTMVTLPLNDGNGVGTAEKVYVSFEIVPNGTADPSSYFLLDDITFDYPTSVAASANTVISTYPNPVNDVLNISEAVSYQVFSLTGAQVLAGNGTVINTSSLPAGSYVLNAVSANGTIVRKKFAKL